MEFTSMMLRYRLYACVYKHIVAHITLQLTSDNTLV